MSLCPEQVDLLQFSLVLLVMGTECSAALHSVNETSFSLWIQLYWLPALQKKTCSLPLVIKLSLNSEQPFCFAFTKLLFLLLSLESSAERNGCFATGSPVLERCCH